MRDGSTTRERIRTEALRLFVAHGVDAVSIRDIAGAAGCRPSALYAHWPSREALVAALFRDGFTEYARRLAALADSPTPFAARLEAMVRLICRLHAEDPARFAFLLLTQHRRLPAIAADADNPIEVLQRAIADAMRDGELPAGDAALVTSAVVGILVQAATFHLYGRLAAPPEALADPLVALCLVAAGLAPAAGAGDGTDTDTGAAPRHEPRTMPRRQTEDTPS
ncbi:TetR/AcrR family transcriptional regulator [Roseomonas sp. NAR14]|uniref:TetR/AcrR family transcriptional regulator n=1 Tax=Roseomonas acroporae TaxID=2937791 RepID=A0A9X1YCU8_9PROT|nr:TetR/AcrR family transcriptional regulator [Roseomonas acroporae]MCK8784156.1 TetR/AcrR family transcriptional regulator [Roseomonas acroporae]